LVEFALLTPFVLVFIAAIVLFGLAFSTRSSLQQGVREAARQIAVGVPVPTAQALAAGNAPDVIAPADVLVCYPDNNGSQGQTGDPVRVYIYKDGAEGYPYALVPLGGIFDALGVTSPVVHMSPRATARLERSRADASSFPCP
jgi:hypothetical protein